MSIVSAALVLLVVMVHTAAAQTAPALPPPRLELAGGGGVAGTSPEFGGLVSLPLGPRLSLDAGVSHLARIFASPPFVLTQLELRIPFRRHLRSRRSLVAGVTDVRPHHRSEQDSPLWRTDGRQTFPHAGASLQWPAGSRADFRLDAELILQFDDEAPVVPRVVGTFVWPPAPRGDAR
jgi:hypothetical protein